MQRVASHLSAEEVASLRLVNNHWRLVIGLSVKELQLPLMVLHPGRDHRSPASRCRRLQYVFPAMRRLLLYRHDGWCDPMQARFYHYKSVYA